MARIIKRGYKPVIEVARYTHDKCDSLVEFSKSDVRHDTRCGSYVVCPACEGEQRIPVVSLTWKCLPSYTTALDKCPKCGSTDYINASQSLDCNSCGHSW